MNKKNPVLTEHVGGFFVKLLGLPDYCTKAVLTLEVGEPVVVDCTYFPSIDVSSGELEECFSSFVLINKEMLDEDSLPNG